MGESEDWEDRKWFNNEDKTTIKSQEHQFGGLVREASAPMARATGR